MVLCSVVYFVYNFKIVKTRDIVNVVRKCFIRFVIGLAMVSPGMYNTKQIFMIIIYDSKFIVVMNFQRQNCIHLSEFL